MLRLLIFFSLILTLSADKKIVLLSGKLTHPGGLHEYERGVMLLKVMLDNCNVKGLKTEYHLQGGWPDDPSTLDDADLILVYSDGGNNTKPELRNPLLMNDERYAVLKKQMERGCGVVALHYSTFSPDKYAQEILKWYGGYFDYEGPDGKKQPQKGWYSKIKTTSSDIKFVNPEHPIHKGVKPFKMKEEWYYELRFASKGQGYIPLWNIPDLDNDSQKDAAIVSWAIQRKDGSRGFGTTTGHFHYNWANPNYRKHILNGIIWSAGLEVPENGVEAKHYTDSKVAEMLGVEYVKTGTQKHKSSVK